MKVRVCSRCGTVVTKSPVKGYLWYCPEHDEDLFGFETEVIEVLDQKTHPTRRVPRRSK